MRRVLCIVTLVVSFLYAGMGPGWDSPLVAQSATTEEVDSNRGTVPLDPTALFYNQPQLSLLAFPCTLVSSGSVFYPREANDSAYNNTSRKVPLNGNFRHGTDRCAPLNLIAGVVFVGEEWQLTFGNSVILHTTRRVGASNNPFFPGRSSLEWMPSGIQLTRRLNL